MSRLYEEAIITDISDPSNKRRVKAALTMYGKDDRNNWNVVTDWIRTFQTPVGQGSEGFYSKLKVGDVILVSFIDYPICQKPFVFARDNANDDDNVIVTDNKIIKFNEHTIEFTNDEVIISQKDGTQITLKSDDSIEFSNTLGFKSIEVGTLNIIKWLLDLCTGISGNLGYPCIVNPTLVAQITAITTTPLQKITFKKDL